MKYNNIPKLLYMPQNGVSIDLECLRSVLERFEKVYGLNLNPDFQRGHEWDETTHIRFMEYIIKGGVVPPLRFNGPLFGGYYNDPKCDIGREIVLVDGKQRLTACLDFLDNKIPVFGGVYLKDFDKPELVMLSTQLTYTVSRFQTRKQLLQFYLEMNEGNVAHSPQELDRVRKLYAEAK